MKQEVEQVNPCPEGELRNPLSIARAWALSLLHIVVFLSNLLLLHLPLVVARLFGVRALDRVLSLHCLIHLVNIRLTGARFTVRHHEHLFHDKPVILVSNHQAMYDIPLIIWNLRARDPKFIAKKELKYWIPSISYALRKGEHLIIDRSRGKESISQIKEYGRECERLGRVICIFPEGTRSSTGTPRAFKLGGFTALLEAMPSAQIVPVSLDGTGQVVRNNLLPVGVDSKILLEFHPSLNREGKSAEALLREAENVINRSLIEFRKITENHTSRQ